MRSIIGRGVVMFSVRVRGDVPNELTCGNSISGLSATKHFRCSGPFKLCPRRDLHATYTDRVVGQSWSDLRICS
jgi:hypothetical protein